MSRLFSMAIDRGEVQLLRVPTWERLGWLRAGFSTRFGGTSAAYGMQYGTGSLNLGFTREDDRTAVGANRRLLLDAVGGGRWRLAAVKQVHGTRVEVAGGDAAGEALVEADGMVTGEPGVLLGVQSADCVPVLVADVRRRVVGAFHAGWRGSAAGMAGVGVARMLEEFGCEPGDLVAAIGPSIGQCCYTVGEEVRAAFAGDLFAGDRLDLWEANRRQLVAAGVPAGAVTVMGECTACRRTGDGSRVYFSHRAERGVTGRAMGVIGVVSPGG